MPLLWLCRSATMRHSSGSHMSHCERCKCKWESFMTNQNICYDSVLAYSVLADAEKLFLDRFLQGESVAESGSIISHYFRTYFSLYVVPRGLIICQYFVVCIRHLEIWAYIHWSTLNTYLKHFWSAKKCSLICYQCLLNVFHTYGELSIDKPLVPKTC